MRRTAWGLGAALWLALAGCDNDGNPLLVASRPGGQLLVTVTEGVTPTYAWDGAPARLLTVRGGGEVRWQIEATDALGFEPPVRHGVTPAGARAVFAPELLEAGVVHTVSITTVDGQQGSRTFTPSPLTP